MYKLYLFIILTIANSAFATDSILAEQHPHDAECYSVVESISCWDTYITHCGGLESAVTYVWTCSGAPCIYGPKEHALEVPFCSPALDRYLDAEIRKRHAGLKKKQLFTKFKND